MPSRNEGPSRPTVPSRPKGRAAWGVIRALKEASGEPSGWRASESHLFLLSTTPCSLGVEHRLRALDGSFTWQKDSQLCASKRRHEWVDNYGTE